MCHQPMLTTAGNPGSQTDAELLDSLARWDRQVRRHQAWIARAIAVLLERAKRDDALFGADCAITKIAQALRLHPDTAHNQIDVAVTLVQRHLPAWEAWEAGQITKRQATLLVHTTDQLGDDLDKAHKAEERILPRMPARAQGSEDGRTLAQRRADALCTMILNPSNTTPGQDPATPAALVQVTVSLETLLALNAQPGELERYGAISADTARALAMAPGSLWRWLAYDPDTGTLIKTAPRVYQPTTEVRRFVQARDRVCALPGCTRPAYRCDLDHVNPFNHDSPQHGRQTTKKNLIPLCHHHHHIKTADSFTVKVIEPGRSIEWTSQHTGHTHHVNHTHDYRPDQQPDILAGWEC